MPIVETLGKPTVSNRDGDPTLGVQSVYTQIFQEKVGDGPIESLQSLVARARPILKGYGEGNRVLDLGAAQGTFRRRYGVTHFQLVELDLAQFTLKQLGSGNYEHLQATGARMPFKNACFDAIVSNLAFDFIHPRAEAMQELYRTLTPGGVALLNLNTRRLMVPDDLDDQIARNNRRIYWKRRYGSQPKTSDLREQVALGCKRTYRENNTFFDTNERERIAADFINQGFRIQRLELLTNNNGRSWWEVDLSK